jgi:hypothetical protein
MGHSIGHSFPHLFGHRGQGASAAASTAIPPEHGRVSALPESVLRVSDRHPRGRFVFRPPIGFCLRRRAFGSGECLDGWFGHNLRFGDSWNCSIDGFFFDPFFFGWFSGSPSYQRTVSDATKETSNSSDSATSSRNGVKAKSSITLLQLRDGSMYGFTGYWVKDGELHYKTTYGGENSLRFERIDFAKTVQLNADRDVPFLLPPQSVLR